MQMKIVTLLAVAAVTSTGAAADCLPPGSTDSQGHYLCSPAHEYPSGQTCSQVDGCYVLIGTNGKPVNNMATTSAAKPSQTSTCAAPGAFDSQGRYSCNPAHEYPSGATCKFIDSCPLLVDVSGKPIIQTSTASAQATQTITCAGPGAYDSKGRYSCNPAHQYSNGETCQFIDGCPLLVDANGKPIIQTASAQPSQTSTCPPPGSTDSQGRYSCNPAHQYPSGQTCNQFDGCYFLCASGQPIKSTPTGQPPVVTAGASARSGASLMMAVGLVLLL